MHPAPPPLRRSTSDHNGNHMPVWEREGTGEGTVLLLHGACADHHSFDAQLAAIPERYTVLIPDLRGQGDAVAERGVPASITGICDDLTAFLSERGIADVVLIGHSFGSHIAQELAWRHPDLVSALVLIGCYDQHGPRDRSERVRVAVTSGVVRVLPWRWFSRFSARVATGDPALRAEVERGHLRAGKTTFLELGRSGSAAKHPVDGYRQPLLLIRGEHEYSATLDRVYARIAARSSAAVTVVVPGAGHLCHQENPGAVNTAITAFLD
ncbi:MAG: alpha/beta fold hydrolase [Mycetocola sp.]